MTDKTPLEAEFEGEIWAPTEFYANHFKLWVAAVVLAAMALFVLWKWIGAPDGDPVVPVMCAVLLGIAWMFAQEARDARPILSYTDKGVEDRRHGFIPWEKVAYFQYKKSIFSQSFGYALVKGEEPPKGRLVWRLQAAVNLISGRPARVWQKHMVVGGLEPMLYGARAKKPALEKA